MSVPKEVIVSSKSGLLQEISAGNHRLLADEPAPSGTDLGVSPYDLLLASLGTCTSMTLRLYAKRKGWDLQGVTVTLRHSRIHALDCQDCETRQGFLDQINLEIVVTGDLDTEQKSRLRAIAEMCPVHKTLESEIRIRTNLA